MSHMAKIELQIKDLESLKKAAATLGLEFVEGQTTHRWYGRSVGDYPLPKGFTKEDLGKCDHAIRIPNNGHAYEIGVVQARDGSGGWVLLWDFWQGGYGLMDKVGSNGVNLKREYGFETAKKTLRRQGYRKFTVVTTAEGKQALRARK